jgi:tetratricopeptide (TPR) repeat protein
MGEDTEHAKRIIGDARRAVELDPEKVGLRLSLAKALEDSGDIPGSLEQFVAALARDPTSLEALRGTAECATALGDAARAQGYRRLLARRRDRRRVPPQAAAEGDHEGRAIRSGDRASVLDPQGRRRHGGDIVRCRRLSTLYTFKLQSGPIPVGDGRDCIIQVPEQMIKMVPVMLASITTCPGSRGTES